LIVVHNTRIVAHRCGNLHGAAPTFIAPTTDFAQHNGDPITAARHVPPGARQRQRLVHLPPLEHVFAQQMMRGQTRVFVRVQCDARRPFAQAGARANAHPSHDPFR
jgi:hypothetical protein